MPPATINGTAKEIPLNSACFSSVLTLFTGCVSCCTVRVSSLRLRVSACWINASAWRIGSATGTESAGMPLKRSLSLMATSAAKIQAVALLS
ncbi:Uncharacterised protein [Shigella sonnei]|nr:Uncharacterised protein [Shigella sonnei]